LSKGCSSNDEDRHTKISPTATHKLKQISDNYQGSLNKADVAKLGAQIAHEFEDDDSPSKGNSALLAIPFSAPVDEGDAQKMADATFAQVYGRMAISHHGNVGLDSSPLASADPAVAIERGRTNHARFVLYGVATDETLTVKIVKVSDGSVMWTRTYSVKGAEPAKIAAEVDTNMTALEDD
jgi:hypothetical protein